MDEAKVVSVLSEHLSMDFFITANADKQTRTKAHEISLDNKISQLKRVLKTYASVQDFPASKLPGLFI